MDVLYSSFLGALFFISSGTQGALLCSQCTSGPHGSCLTSPPKAKKCPHTTNNNVNCMTAKKYSDNGTLLEFSRGCTMVRVGEGCVDHKDNTTLCYVACHTDNCNQTSSYAFSATLLLVSLVLDVIFSV